MWNPFSQLRIQVFTIIKNEFLIVKIRNFKSLMLEQGNMLEKFNNLAPIAAKNNVFGSPSYVVNDEVFWGQDRLELFEKAIKKIIK